MRVKNRISVILSIMLTTVACWAQQPEVQTAPPGSTGSRVQSNYGHVPLMFEANQGQTDSQVKFLSQGKGYTLFLTSGGMVLALRPSKVGSSQDVLTSSSVGGIGRGASSIHQLEKAARAQRSSAATFTVNLLGSSANPQVVGEQPLRTRVNYFIGRDPKKWRTNVATYARIRYRNVYPGIDLVYYGNNGRVEYDFDLAPGADATQIQFRVQGADALKVDGAGNLLMTKGATELRFQTPTLYQEVNGARQQVPGAYALRDGTHVGFTVSNYDNTKPLVIDPVLVYSTFLGGSDDDFSNGIAVDSAGDAFVIGITDSPDFPLASIGSYTPTQFRMFLTEFDPTGSTLLFADYFGGTSGDDEPSSITLDSSGNPYVTGSAVSTDFPVVNAYQTTLSGSRDAFLVKFSADGSSISYSTYLGGSNSQFARSVSVDPAGEVVIAGETQSTDFPMANAYQSSVSPNQFGNWGEYGFITKFAANGTSLVFSTYLAGSTMDIDNASCNGCFPESHVMGVVTDASGNVYLSGYTTTADFPVTPGAFMTTYPASFVTDVGFVSKFTSSGAIAYSTYLGGYISLLFAIAVDANGSAYVTGYELIDNAFPVVTTSLCDPSLENCSGAVVAKLDPTGSSLLYSTYLAPPNGMLGRAIQVDAFGNAFIVGNDVQFSLSNPIEGYTGIPGGGEVVVAEIDSAATTQLMATFLGGSGWEAVASLALDSNGAVYVTGVTESSDFPVTQSAFQTGFGGQTDVFISKLDPNTNAPAVAMAPFSVQFGSENVGSTSAPQTSILRNMGSAALTISSKTVTGDYAETDDCGSTVAAASFCTFTITFTPTVSGADDGVLTIADDAQGSPHSVSLLGIGISGPSSFSASPSSLRFSSSPVGVETAAQTVTIRNTSNAVLNISGVQVSDGFAAAASNCGSVPVSQTCIVQVSFMPTSAGMRTGTVRLTKSATGNSQVVALSGSGIDFVTSATNSSAAVKAGGSATYQLTVGSTGGNFSNSVSFSCSGAPANASCNVGPRSVTPGNNSTRVTVTVQTAGTNAQVSSPAGSQRRFLVSWVLGQIGIFGVLLLGRKDRRKKLAQHVALAIIIVTLLLLAGCAGASTGSRSPSASGATPPGTYTLKVIGTSGAVQHSTTLTLIVR